MDNVLFVCKANASRSPFAARWLREESRLRGLELDVQSAGTYVNHPLGRKLTPELARWATYVFPMDKMDQEETYAFYESHKITLPKMHVVGVPDHVWFLEADNHEMRDKPRFSYEDALEVITKNKKESQNLSETPKKVFKALLQQKVLLEGLGIKDWL